MVYKILKNFKILALCVVLCFISFVNSDASYRNSVENKFSLDFKQVVLSLDDKLNEDYEPGKKNFPEYSYWGLPDKFYIKKRPNFSLRSNEIERIEIRRMPYVRPNSLDFRITIFINKSAKQKIYDYSIDMVNEKVALSIGGKIFYLATIMEPINGKLTFNIIEKPFTAIRDLLSPLSENIETENIQDIEIIGTH